MGIGATQCQYVAKEQRENGVSVRYERVDIQKSGCVV